METTPKPSAYFRECCPFYYLWKSEQYFYILWCSYFNQKKKKKERGNFYSCVKTVNSGVVWVHSSSRSDMVFHSCSKCASEREAPPRGRHFRGFSTEHKYALVVWECPEDVRGRTKEDHCASTAAAWANSMFSLHFPKLICRTCPNRPSDTSLLCQTHSRLSTCFWCKDPDGFPNAFQNGLNPESSFSGKTADGSMFVMPECMVKTSLCSSPLFWKDTLNISLQCFSSDVWITAW